MATKRVFLLAGIAVGGEHIDPGQVVELDAALAAELLGGGRALPEDAPPPATPPAKE